MDNMKARLGVGYENLDQDRKDPEEKKGQSLENDMVTAKINAARTAMDSVKAGNKDDVGRITMFMRQLNNMQAHDPVVHTHKADFKKLEKEINEIVTKSPDLDLGEARLALAKLVK